MVALVVIAFLLIGIIEIVPMVKENQKKELVLYSVLFAAAFVLSILLSLGVKIPSPSEPIEHLVRAVTGIRE